MMSVKISQIRPHSISGPLEVRIVKKWITYGHRNELCYLFVDIQGDAIEGVADAADTDYFDNLITPQLCYTISGYLTTPSRSSMKTVSHAACITLGKAASFVPLTNANIPYHYYDFADYEMLKTRLNDHRLLTGVLQLESSSATTVVVNPPIQQLHNIITRFKELNTTSTQAPGSSTTLWEYGKNKQNRFTCVATIINIDSNRTWFYKSCSECRFKVIPQDDLLMCKNHGQVDAPRYMYCIHTTITDETSTAKAVFFDDVVKSLLQIECKDLVLTQGFTDPKLLPPAICLLQGKPMTLQVKMESENSVIVNKVYDPPTISLITSPSPSIDISPATPITKSTKRQLQPPAIQSKLPATKREK
ncbi:hypothetical protein R6Q59_035294 [Mikania micrantha]